VKDTVKKIQEAESLLVTGSKSLQARSQQVFFGGGGAKFGGRAAYIIMHTVK